MGGGVGLGFPDLGVYGSSRQQLSGVTCINESDERIQTTRSSRSGSTSCKTQNEQDKQVNKRLIGMIPG